MGCGTTRTLTFIGKKIKYKDFPYKEPDIDVINDYTSVDELEIEGINVKLVLQFNPASSFALFIVKELITTDMHTPIYCELQIEANCSSFIEFNADDLLSPDISDNLKKLLTPLELITMHEVY
jgi:hypothetical protein